jgi:hypothetical protein
MSGVSNDTPAPAAWPILFAATRRSDEILDANYSALPDAVEITIAKLFSVYEMANS